MNAINKLYLALESANVTGLSTEHWNQEVDGNIEVVRRVQWRNSQGVVMEAIGIVRDSENVVDVHFKATPSEVVEMML